jgi:uncharacterized protein (TIGR02444 family)
MAPASRPVAAAAFWRFSLAFYALPGVMPALLALQDRDGYDVNLILFAVWYGLSGRGRLDRDRLAGAERGSAGLRSEIVVPLRALRRRIEPRGEADLERLRAAIARLELAAERAVQRRLAAYAGRPDGLAAAGRRRADARANLALYLGAGAARGSAAVVVRRALAGYPLPPLRRRRHPPRRVRPSA